jgi:putative oxidoreductase
MRTEFMAAMFVLGRFFLGAHFFIAGIRNFLMLPVWIERMEGRGLPQPKLALTAGFAVQTLSGALVALGLWPSLGGVALIAFTVVATVLWHNFWNFAGEERRVHINFNLTNVALIGALLMVVATA